MRTLTLVDNNMERGLRFNGHAPSYNEQHSAHENQGQNEAGGVYNLKVRPLTSAGIGRLSKQKKAISSYWSLASVIFFHIIALLALINAKTTEPVIKELPAPMMVSLVASPAPEIVPLVPTPPKPVVKQQKPIVKKLQPTPKPVPVAQEVAQPVVTEAPPTPDAPVVIAKAPEVVEVPPPKAAPEPVTEPPRFGAAYLNNPAPDYPQMARRLGQEGRVLLKVLVAESGMAQTVELAKSSGHEKLDQAAIEAVKKWSFIPAKRSNQPISAYVLVPIKFSLNN
jgi:periplasmic protein TonB